MKGRYGWLALAALVVLVDMLADDGETLSEAAYRARQQAPILVWFAIIATAFHLLFGDHPRLSRVDTYKIPARAIRHPRKALRGR